MLAVIALEAVLIITIRYFRREFQWLITEKDNCPELDQKGLEKFFKHGYDPYLGWCRKPNTSGVEKGQCGQVKYSIDSLGSRSNPLAKGTDNVIATYGDSYAFCRQVNDNETWQFFLTQKTNIGVLNFGVGNYGVDQALLRYEQMELPSSIKIVVLAFVPENICRIHSYWKHYLEFGNTFAFKPRFRLENQKLVLYPNVMKSELDFSNIKKKLKFTQKIDGFYKTKFRSLQFRIPYTISFLRHPRRNIQILYSLCVCKLARLFNISSSRIENTPFKIIMLYNIKQAHAMYKKSSAVALFKEILLRFNNEANKRGHKALITVLPQLIDLKVTGDKEPAYKKFFKDMSCQVPVIDFSEVVRKQKPEQMYAEDIYGGHYSPEGNEILSNYLLKKLNELFPFEMGLK